MRALVADLGHERVARPIGPRLLLAILLPIVALPATAALAPILLRSQTLLFLLAVAISSWFGGFVPGIITTILSILLLEYYLIPPLGTFLPRRPEDLTVVILFAGSAYIVTRLSDQLHRARRRAAESARRAVGLATELESKAGELEQRIIEAQSMSLELEDKNAQIQESARDLLQARDDADAERTRVQRILDGLPDAASAFDQEWRYTYLNPRAGELLRRLGHDPSQAIGRTVWEIFPMLVGTPYESAARHAMRGHRIVELEDYVPALSAWLESRFVPIAEGIVAYSRDITHRKRADARQALLQRVTSALGEVTTIDRIADVAITYGTEAAGAVAGMLLLVTDTAAGESRLEVVRADGFARDDVAAAATTPLTPGLALAEALDGGRLVLTRGGLAALSRRPATAGESEMTGEGLAIVPIGIGERALGVLCFGFPSTTGGWLDADQRSLLMTLAQQCGQALERAQLFEAERHARAEAEGASRAKTEFLATMSHELRTPLNAIAGYTELLEIGLRGPITAEQREDLQRIRRSQRYLLGLINDVLNFAKIESGHVRYDIRDFVLDDALLGIEALVAPQLRGKEMRYDYLRVNREVIVRADAEKLEQIILNLLSNAVKFTERGGHIQLSGEVRDETVLVRVRDTGRGIPENRLDAIFEPFVQVERGLTRTSEGTGLGLAISRDLARAMGGDLSASSGGREGSTFTLTIRRAPLNVADRRGDAPADVRTESPPMPRPAAADTSGASAFGAD